MNAVKCLDSKENMELNYWVQIYLQVFYIFKHFSLLVFQLFDGEIQIIMMMMTTMILIKEIINVLKVLIF